MYVKLFKCGSHSSANVDFGMRKKTHLLIPQSVLVIPNCGHSEFRTPNSAFYFIISISPGRLGLGRNAL